MESANNVGDTALALSPSFGIPATVCTNVSRAAGIVSELRMENGESKCLSTNLSIST